MAALQIDDVTKTIQDAAYVTVGLGVIAFQRAQVRRQELRKTLEDQVDGARGSAQALSSMVEDRVKLLEERLAAIEEQVETAVERIEAQLPEQVAEASRGARTTAKDVREQVRGQVRNLAK